MLSRGLGDSGKGDREAWGAHSEGKGPWGVSALPSPVYWGCPQRSQQSLSGASWLCSPSPDRLFLQ